jgi:hypothetical protein
MAVACVTLAVTRVSTNLTKLDVGAQIILRNLRRLSTGNGNWASVGPSLLVKAGKCRYTYSIPALEYRRIFSWTVQPATVMYE